MRHGSHAETPTVFEVVQRAVAVCDPDGDAPEAEPLGPAEPRPEGEGPPERGDDAMPGIPSEGEPPSGG